MATKKDSDEKKVEEITDGFREIVSGSGQNKNFGDQRTADGTLRAIDNALFFHSLEKILERYNAKWLLLAQLLRMMFRGEKEIDAVSNIVELRELIFILTRRDFFRTTSRDKQEKYIKLMLDYLVRKLPEDYDLLLSYVQPVERQLVNRNQTVVVAKLIVEQLADDSTINITQPTRPQEINTTICPNCGYRMQEAFQFCPVCGRQIISVSKTSSETSESTQTPERVSLFQRILNRLAGDTTTDAPPPEVSKKKKRK
jgi:hypothetical protein